MKKIFITGASRGIGKKCAELSAENGFEVYFTYNRSDKEAEELQNRLQKKVPCHSFKIDLADFETSNKIIESIIFQNGPFDYLINNAGISDWGLIQDVTSEKYDKLMNVNLKSVFFITSQIAKGMISNTKGSIVNISSVWGETGASCEALYSMSKAGIIGFTKSLAKELAPMGIRVNSVSPGVVDTDMMNRFSLSEKNEIAEEIPMGRFADTREIAEVCMFLLSDKASYITGQDIGVNGGMYC